MSGAGVSQTGGAGCGRFTRDELELAAIARSDPQAPVADGLPAHLSACPVCAAIVDRIAADNALLAEFAQAAPMPAAPRSTEESGPILGYRLGDEIHRGAQGAVYRAEQLATRRTCAVKMLLDRKSTRLNSSHTIQSRMPSSA